MIDLLNAAVAEDPKRAAAALAGIETDSTTARALANWYQYGRRTDPLRAILIAVSDSPTDMWSYLMGLPPTIRSYAWKNFIEVYDVYDSGPIDGSGGVTLSLPFPPERLLEFAALLPTDSRGQDLLHQIAVPVISNKNPQRAIRLLDFVRHSRRDHIRNYVVKQWFDQDPDAAVGYLIANPASQVPCRLDSALHTLALKNAAGLERSLAIVKTLPADFGRRDEHWVSVLRAMIPTDPERAIALAHEDPHVQFLVAKDWARQDRNAAVAWASNQSGALRARMLAGIVHAENSQHIAESAAMVAEISGFGFEAKTLETMLHEVESLTKDLARDGRDGALKWIESLHEGPIEETALLAIAEGWGRKDTLAAVEWAYALPEGEMRDRVMDRVLHFRFSHQIPIALAWASEVPDPNRRAALLRFAVEVLAKRDREFAIKVVRWLPDDEPRKELMGIFD